MSSIEMRETAPHGTLSPRALLDLIESCNGWDDAATQRLREQLISARINRLFNIAELLMNKPIHGHEDHNVVTRTLCSSWGRLRPVTHKYKPD
jgi:hypothetical protein